MKFPLPLFLCGGLLAGFSPKVRAQLTESPHTVQPGKFLLEVDGLRLSFDRAAGEKYRGLAVASSLFTTGLTRAVDVQVGADVFLRQSFHTSGGRDAQSGVGDLSFRTKWTFWQDENLGAAAVIPFVRLPTSSSGVGTDAVDGGFSLPWERALRAGVMAGAMLHWHMLRNDDDNGYDAEWLISGYMQRKLAAGWDVYGECVFDANSARASNWAGKVAAGALWTLSSHLQFDYELLRGLNRRATDWTHIFRVNWHW